MGRPLAWLLAIFAVAGLTPCASNDGASFHGDYSKLSGIIIPGFASTQLRAWSILDCPFSPLDFNPLDLVWLDTTKEIKREEIFLSSYLIMILFFSCHVIKLTGTKELMDM